jgi:ArsR family transcriptional regulator
MEQAKVAEMEEQLRSEIWLHLHSEEPDRSPFGRCSPEKLARRPRIANWNPVSGRPKTRQLMSSLEKRVPDSLGYGAEHIEIREAVFVETALLSQQHLLILAEGRLMPAPIPIKEFYRRHADMCRVFAHPLLLELLQLLHERGECTVSDLAEATGVRMANLSQHLAVMRSTTMVLSRKEGASVFYRLADPRIMQAFDLITQVLLDQMARDEELRREFATHGIE